MRSCRYWLSVSEPWRRPTKRCCNASPAHCARAARVASEPAYWQAIRPLMRAEDEAVFAAARQLRRGHSAANGCRTCRRPAAAAGADRQRSGAADAGRAVPERTMSGSRWPAGWRCRWRCCSGQASHWWQTPLLLTPAAVLDTFWQALQSGELPEHLLVTLRRVLIAFGPMALGTLLGGWAAALANALLDPLLVLFSTCRRWSPSSCSTSGSAREAAAVLAVVVNKVPNVAVTVREAPAASTPARADGAGLRLRPLAASPTSGCRSCSLT